MLKVFQEFDELVNVITLLCILIQTYTLYTLVILHFKVGWPTLDNSKYYKYRAPRGTTVEGHGGKEIEFMIRHEKLSVSFTNQCNVS